MSIASHEIRSARPPFTMTDPDSGLSIVRGLAVIQTTVGNTPFAAEIPETPEEIAALEKWSAHQREADGGRHDIVTFTLTTTEGEIRTIIVDELTTEKGGGSRPPTRIRHLALVYGQSGNGTILDARGGQMTFTAPLGDPLEQTRSVIGEHMPPPEAFRHSVYGRTVPISRTRRPIAS